MKRFVSYLALIVAALFLSTTLFAEDFSSVVGKWKTKDDETGEFKSIVELYVAKDGTLQGKISKLLLKNAVDKCDKCPGDSSYALNTPIEGMIFVWDVKKLNEKSGKIFDPAKAKTYSVQFWKEGNLLKVRGYIAFFFRTQTWYPAE
jgi:uncharacterized protein (DUF2147 family)